MSLESAIVDNENYKFYKNKYKNNENLTKLSVVELDYVKNKTKVVQNKKYAHSAAQLFFVVVVVLLCVCVFLFFF